MTRCNFLVVKFIPFSDEVFLEYEAGPAVFLSFFLITIFECKILPNRKYLRDELREVSFRAHAWFSKE